MTNTTRLRVKKEKIARITGKNNTIIKTKNWAKFGVFCVTNFLICSLIFSVTTVNSDATFFTTNAKKFKTARKIFKEELGIDLKNNKSEIVEIQGTVNEIILDKLIKVVTNIKTGDFILVDDTSIFFEGLPNFPPMYAKAFIDYGIDFLCKIFTVLGDKKCNIKTIFGLAFKPNDWAIHMQFFEGEVKGEMKFDKKRNEFSDIFISNEQIGEYAKVIPTNIGRFKALKHMVKYIKENFKKKN